MAMTRAPTICNNNRSCRSATRPIPEMPHHISGNSIAASSMHAQGWAVIRDSLTSFALVLHEMIEQLRRIQLAWVSGTNSVRHGSDRSVQHCLDWETRSRRRSQFKLHSSKMDQRLWFTQPTYLLWEAMAFGPILSMRGAFRQQAAEELNARCQLVS